MNSSNIITTSAIIIGKSSMSIPYHIHNKLHNIITRMDIKEISVVEFVFMTL